MFLIKKWKKLWMLIGVHRFWLVGPLWIVVNGYVRRGDDESLWLPTSPQKYFSRLMLRPLLCVSIVWALFYFNKKYAFWDYKKLDGIDPFSMIMSVFPNILGFGMGVYALMFALPHDFVIALNSEHAKNKRKVGGDGLNSIMAYPLCAYALMIVLSPFLSIFSDKSEWVKIIGLGVYVYGMYLCVELVCVLYLAARRSVRISSDKNPLKKHKVMASKSIVSHRFICREKKK